MSERNQIKNRKCKRCGECVRGKAFKLREHTRSHVSVEREAAAQAVLTKLHEDMLRADVLPATPEQELRAEFTPEEFSELKVRLKDESVFNAEGD
jgi:hypothetical protein